MNNLLFVEDVLRRLRIGRTQFWQLRRRGDFPPPCRMGRPLRWRELDVEQWINERAEGCDDRF